MKMSLSIEKGSGSLKHNFDKEYRKKQKHIIGDPNKNIMILQNDLEEVYDELFGNALIEYNAKKTRSDRKIKNYYEHIKKGKQEKLFQELIITIGNMDDKDKENIIVQIYQEIVPVLIEKYPNLRFFGATIHRDESGIGHIHLDYVPFITNAKRGLSTRVSMDGALKEMGFKPETSRLNLKSKRPIIFNALRNDIERIVEDSMRKHGIEHLDLFDDHNKMFPEEYRKYKQEEKEVKESVNRKKDEENQLENKITSLHFEVSELETNKNNAKKEAGQLEDVTNQLSERKRLLEGSIKELNTEVSALKIEKEKTIEVTKKVKMAQKELKAIPFRENTLNKMEVIIPKEDFEKLKKNQIRLIDKNNNLTKNNENLTIENEDLLNENEKLSNENEYLISENDELVSNNIMMESYIEGKGLETDYQRAKPILSKLADMIRKPFNYIFEQYQKIIQTLKQFGLNANQRINQNEFKTNIGLEKMRNIKTPQKSEINNQLIKRENSI